MTAHHKSTFTARVATLTDADPGGAPSDYSGQINWGDGSTSACPSTSCPIVQASGGFAVRGTHNYRRSGTYTVVIQLRDAGGAAANTTTTIAVN